MGTFCTLASTPFRPFTPSQLSVPLNSLQCTPALNFPRWRSLIFPGCKRPAHAQLRLDAPQKIPSSMVSLCIQRIAVFYKRFNTGAVISFIYLLATQVYDLHISLNRGQLGWSWLVLTVWKCQLACLKTCCLGTGAQVEMGMMSMEAPIGKSSEKSVQCDSAISVHSESSFVWNTMIR